MDEWWRGSVTYQVYPRSFQDSDGDGIGDIPGITRRLGHVAGLGADALWLSPVFPSPMADMGYDVSDYCDIEPLFGSLADFDALLERAHGLGLKLIIDQVLSHTSERHPWFTESRSGPDNAKSDWYVWADPRPDGTPPNNWVSVFGGPAWEWEPVRRQYYLHNFLKEQPDLNFHNPQVQDALLDAMRFWLDRGVDGFRLDTVNFYFHDAKLRDNKPSRWNDDGPPVNPYGMQQHDKSRSRKENIAFLKRMRALLDEYDGRTLLGEVGDKADKATRVMGQYTKGKKRLHMAYSFGMLGDEFSAGHFRSRIEDFFGKAPDGWPCWSFSNHDVIRHATRWAEHGASRDGLARLSAAMLLSFRGSVCIYQGEELGPTETELEFSELTDPPGIRFWPEYKGRDGCRTPVPWEERVEHGGFTTGTPWLPLKPEQAACSASGQEGDPSSVLEFYREMLTFRRSRGVLRYGSMVFFDLDEPVLGFLRCDGSRALAAVFNLSGDKVRLRVKGLNRAAGSPSQEATLSGGNLRLGPNGFAFLDVTGKVADAKIRSGR